MIELHRQGRRDHVLVDDEGWAALKSKVASLPATYGSSMLGIDVYRDECPCDSPSQSENVDSPREES